MKCPIVSVRDSAAKAFNRPFTVPSVGLAIRSFGDEAKRVAPDNAMSSHPGDFELWLVGYFDEETGLVEPAPHVSLSRAADHVASGPVGLVDGVKYAS